MVCTRLVVRKEGENDEIVYQLQVFGKMRWSTLNWVGTMGSKAILIGDLKHVIALIWGCGCAKQTNTIYNPFDTFPYSRTSISIKLSPEPYGQWRAEIHHCYA